MYVHQPHAGVPTAEAGGGGDREKQRGTLKQWSTCRSISTGVLSQSHITVVTDPE